uniref:Uncharacterized protein n=1 Tax=Avena sativa TaxID=4498 RepID=A0ACD5TMH6_AVESA
MPDSVAAAGEDLIGALPDDILRLVLSFLPSRESVYTCVLARRWRNLWKSVPRVVIYKEEDARFVTSLLLLRDRAPLHEFVFISFLDGTPQDVEMWIRYAASCHVRVLDLAVHRYDFTERLWLPNMTLVCQHLTTLDICGVKLEEQTLDFSCCPVLDVLEMQDCEINAEKISCQSLRHLSMDVCSFPLGVRTHISCPSLAALELTENVRLTPFLESMPSLVTAFVRFDTEWSEHEEPYDHCLKGGYYGYCNDGFCLAYGHIDSEGDVCVLLDGLCGATDLKLISTPKMIICTRDFKWRHIFSKLKTLYLSEWCLAADFSGLVYFLQHSPILEKLTLAVAVEICEEESLNIQDDSYKPSKHFAISKNLKVVEIKCCDKVESIHHIVEILDSLGVPPEHIKNQHKHQSSDRLSFEDE